MLRNSFSEHVPAAVCRSEVICRGASSSLFGDPLWVGFLTKDGVECDAVKNLHKRFAMVLVLRGRGTYRCDESGREWPLEPGCVFVRHPFWRHSNRIDADSQWAECFVAVDRGLTRGLEILGLYNETKPVWQLPVRPWWESVAKLMAEAAAAPGNKLDEVVWKCVSLMREWAAENSADDRGDLSDTPLQRALESLESAATTRGAAQNLPDLFASVGLGYSRLRVRFREVMGVGPGEYLIRRRIEIAQSMLIESEAPVREISDRLGYTDPFTFSRQFKRITGHSPRAFRKQFASGK